MQQRQRQIEVRQTETGDPLVFDVTVREGTSETRHQVTVAQALYRELTGGAHTPEVFVNAAFRFLLDRETKESILPRFDVTLISRYFPEFRRVVPRYLLRGSGEA